MTETNQPAPKDDLTLVTVPISKEWLVNTVPSFREFVERHIVLWARKRESSHLITGKPSSLPLGMPPHPAEEEGKVVSLLVELRDQYQFEGKLVMAGAVDHMLVEGGHPDLIRPPMDVGDYA